jgi:hypothetical protein
MKLFEWFRNRQIKKRWKEKKVYLDGVEVKPFKCQFVTPQFNMFEAKILSVCLDMAETAKCGSDIKDVWRSSCKTLREKLLGMVPKDCVGWFDRSAT